MAKLEIQQFPCLSDNFGVLIHDSESATTVAIDAPEAKAVTAALQQRGWTLTHILTTHHHGDHTGGNLALKGASHCTIIGPRGEAAKIPGIDTSVGGGEALPIGSYELRVLDTPGHTAGHITYWIPSQNVVFVGDTLFAIGCGRIIEGNAQMMWESLKKLMALPKETAIYCGHEYTQSNARFALTIEPENRALQTRARDVDELRAAGKATLPSTVGLELETNPFLRPHVAAIQTRLGMMNRREWEIFGEIRARKDRA
jgi:hydroxyacylglutathione hydrolase